MAKSDISFEIVIYNGEEKDRAEYLKSEIELITAPELKVEKTQRAIGGWGASWEILVFFLITAEPYFKTLSYVNVLWVWGERLLKLMKKFKKMYFDLRAIEQICCFLLKQRGIEPEKVLETIDLTTTPMYNIENMEKRLFLSLSDISYNRCFLKCRASSCI